MARLFLVSAVVAAASAQQIGTLVPEVHPKLPTQFCTRDGGCTTKQTSVVAEALFHPIHVAGDPDKSCNPNPRPGRGELARVESGVGLSQGHVLVMTRVACLLPAYLAWHSISSLSLLCPQSVNGSSLRLARWCLL
ncbi:hypothetical protein F5883DRAFT_571274 [Diaporthe sp. PMI_573]|nr:hypothetical protein F5883DRAFT_571274 [Diaporthaceae sp. PMI_573]